jgi:peptidoglycan lytic transglycosylase G
MSDDWLTEDPFADPNDPAAAERERRRREREDRRRRHEEKRRSEDVVDQPPPPPPGAPPAKGPEEEALGEGPVGGEHPSDETATPGPGTVLRHRRRKSPGSPRRSSTVLAGLRRHPLGLLAAIVAVALIWFLVALFQPFHGDGSGRVAVAVPKGASVAEVGDLLDSRGVISSSTLFQIRVTLAGKRSDLYPGHYVLAHDMSYGAAIDALSKPPMKRTVTVTIPEGYSRPQTAQLAEEDGLAGSYMKESVRSRYLNPAKYGGAGARDLEGFLFPDTFELKPGEPVADLVQLQLEDFKRRIAGVNMGYARSKNLTTYDVVTIASMIEREAQLDSQRKLVAAVIYNRLQEGMPLGIDATIRFATGNYTRPLTESELAVESPYNTRTHAGLPPGPIDSPGLASLEAAARPAHVDYRYYVVKPGTCGELAFSSTAAQFERDVARYNEAREAAGGNSPTSCP